jgi:hypothetical protein
MYFIHDPTHNLAKKLTNVGHPIYKEVVFSAKLSQLTAEAETKPQQAGRRIGFSPVCLPGGPVVA